MIKVRSIHERQIYAMKIMSKSQIVKDNAVQQVKGKYKKIFDNEIRLLDSAANRNG